MSYCMTRLGPIADVDGTNFVGDQREFLTPEKASHLTLFFEEIQP